jgi:hypothetical protein
MYQFYSFWFNLTGTWQTIYRTQSEYANHYMTDVVFLLIDDTQNQKILIL